MSQTIKLYSFADVDRSGKIRWTACELGYEIKESRLELGEHRQPEYLKLNPYAQIPTAIVDGEAWIESTAICLSLAEKHPQAGLIPSAPDLRAKFWQYLHLTSSTLEMPVVAYILESRGVGKKGWQDLLGDDLRKRLEAFASDLPPEAYLCGSFSIADVCAGYVLRIAVQAGLLPFEGRLAAYMDRLRARPAAIQSRIFDTLEV